MANEFLPFASGVSANVLTPAEYAALTSIVSNGFQSGILTSERLNTVLRQAAMASAVLGEIINDAGGSAADNGDVSAFQAALMLAIASRTVAFRAHKNGTDQAISTSTWTKITFSTETIDTNNAFASSTFTCPVAGIYRFSLISTVTPGTVSGGATRGAIYVNGAANAAAYSRFGDNTVTSAHVSALVSLSVGNTVDAYAWHDSGVSGFVLGDAVLTTFSGELVR